MLSLSSSNFLTLWRNTNGQLIMHTYKQIVKKKLPFEINRNLKEKLNKKGQLEIKIKMIKAWTIGEINHISNLIKALLQNKLFYQHLIQIKKHKQIRQTIKIRRRRWSRNLLRSTKMNYEKNMTKWWKC